MQFQPSVRVIDPVTLMVACFSSATFKSSLRSYVSQKFTFLFLFKYDKTGISIWLIPRYLDLCWTSVRSVNFSSFIMLISPVKKPNYHLKNCANNFRGLAENPWFLTFSFWAEFSWGFLNFSLDCLLGSVLLYSWSATSNTITIDINIIYIYICVYLYVYNSMFDFGTIKIVMQK